jgi:hypothetical protein
MADCKRAMLADPFLNDDNFLLCVLSLEELGATGNKVLHLSHVNLTIITYFPAQSVRQ